MLLQALVVTVLYAFAIVLIFMPSIPYDDHRFSLRRRAMYAVGMAVYAISLTFGITCAVEGGCVSMTWVTVIAYAVVPVLFVFMYALAFVTMERLRSRSTRLWNAW